MVTEKFSRKYKIRAYPPFPTINIPYQSSAFATVHEPTLTHPITQSLWFTLGLILGVVRSMGLASIQFF